MTTATLTAAGYRVTKTDEALIFHDVPIFSACQVDDKFTANELWVKAAAKKALAEAREGFYPPLHIRHHEMETAMNDSVRRAGWFEVTGVRPITLAGKRRNAIFADLHFTDEWAAQEALKMQLPYRSVEINNVKKPPSIDGLALLEHESPFLRLPMLRPAEVNDKTTDNVPIGTFRQPWSMDASQNDYGVVACLREGNKATLLFRQEQPMKKTPEEIAAAEAAKKVATQAALFKDNGDDDKNDKGENLEEGGEGALDVGAVVKAIKSGTIMQKDLDAILAAIQEQGHTEEPGDTEPAPAAVPGGEAMKEGGTLLEKLVGLAAENVKMRADITAMQSTTTRDKDVTVALKRLEGRALGDVKTDAPKWHEALGSKGFKMLVDVLAKQNGVLPDDDDTGGVTLKGASELAMTFADKGKAAVEYATGLEKQHEWMSKNTRTDVTLKECVEIGMEKWVAAQSA